MLDGRAVSQVDKRPGSAGGPGGAGGAGGPGCTEIRVHEAYGGSTRAVPLEPAAERAALGGRWAWAAAELLGRPLDYGRVDLMELDGRLVVGEVELIEPGLYLDVVPGNAAPFAELVRRRTAG